MKLQDVLKVSKVQALLDKKSGLFWTDIMAKLIIGDDTFIAYQDGTILQQTENWNYRWKDETLRNSIDWEPI